MTTAGIDALSKVPAWSYHGAKVTAQGEVCKDSVNDISDMILLSAVS